MMRIKNKNLVLLSLVILFSVCEVKITNADFIDDIKSFFGITKETKAKINDLEETPITSNIEIQLDSRQQEVVSEIENIYQNIQNVDLAKLSDEIDYDIPKQVIFNVNEFFKEYDSSHKNAKTLLSTIKYKIIDISNIGDRIVVKIEYITPSISKIITKILPEVLLKNAQALLNNKLTNENLDSILGILSKEIEKGTYEIETYTKDFNFENFNGKWKLIGVNSIIKDVIQYVNGLAKLF